MIRRLLILLTVMSSLPLLGQTKLTAEQQKQMIEKIDKTASAMTGMQCEFTQTKSMKLLSKEMQSKGIMYFKRPNKLRWQYTSPYDYTFILNGDKVQIKSSKSTKNIDVQGNKMFRQITNIILNSVTGGSLKSSSDFNVEVYKKDNSYFAKLFPKKKELKQLYQVIEIYFDPALTMVNSVRMVEKTGDETRVNLINTKLNVAVDEKMFAVH
ncbi:MAG: outer membrane lipoprotein carrier protein LolA [Prevotella sp.]|jgi:outer membrane lipoprotein-sorting protein|nr:outer membrane lipoprotein carrier protein LolA [Prevotella sp.]MBQ8990690.1 outer membrane lipoprotein carrier protein LolA [Prevotella sp.]